jgi:hypothetical protein
MIVLLNVASTWLTLSHVQDVLVFNLGLETKNLSRGFFLCSFPQSLQADAKIVPEIITPLLASLFFIIY